MTTSTPTKTLHDVLEQFRAMSTSERQKGDKFERLMCAFFNTDPTYKDLFSNVWMLNEWEGRKNHGNSGNDVGIDLVAEERNTGDLWAIQCKFYDPHHTLQKTDIDSFFTASGKEPFRKRMIVTTTNRWGKHALKACENQQIPTMRLGIEELAESKIDWSQFDINRLDKLKTSPPKKLRDHQKEALEAVQKGFETADRGKLIMACGTGKTFTSLKIAETVAPQKGTVLFLVPSISLLSQSLREWTNEREHPFHAFAVCSDTKVGKPSKGKDENEDISITDLCFPATTNAQSLMRQFNHAQKLDARWNVVFSTYQSIEAVSNAQKAGLPEFDMIICDEAHRTTGATLSGADESHFVKVHDNTFIKAKKRLYMTATPKLFKDEVKAKALENDALLCSMDDENYGEVFYELDFSKAVKLELLTDYKVLVLAIDEAYMSSQMQFLSKDDNNEISTPDAAKITGCWKALSKKCLTFQDGTDIDKIPMKRAVAFCDKIESSKDLSKNFQAVVQKHISALDEEEKTQALTCHLKHVDGTMNVLERNEKLTWLKEEIPENECRILSNARCLSEGVDVPSLDAVIFLNPRNSMVDVVQSVGRVMRKSENKQYGYVILPITIPIGMTPDEALNDNKKYKVVWQVLNALRSHDKALDAEINKLDLGVPTKKIETRLIGGQGDESTQTQTKLDLASTIDIASLKEWRDSIYSRIVKKCGKPDYWDHWAKEVAEIAKRHILRLTQLMNEPNAPYKDVFERFVQGLRLNLNPSISEADAIEMLAQHLITKPVFDALFENYAFTDANPVSQAMQHMLDRMEGEGLEGENKLLEKFYNSVKEKIKEMNTPEARQKIIYRLYDQFFKTAFPKVVEKLGIVYTPVEVVDFIIHSANDALQKEFGKSFGDAGVHVLDPFTGTGTFMVRLLQSGLIPQADLARKYQEELHANELVLLAYYIAAINIEETYHGLMGEDRYTPFEGMVLTDTFQLTEGDGKIEGVFPDNSTRANKQRQNDIQVIIGNPPYSAGQKSENDGNKNLKYPSLDEKIRSSYAKHSSATLKNSLYDSYIRAIRWASDRLKDKGVICFVTNGSFLDGNAMDGLRKCLADEFTSVYIFNLRGNQRTSGETSRMEGGKIFDSGSRATIAITLLVKNPDRATASTAEIYYHDIGDYLDRKEKLQIIADFKSMAKLPMKRLKPNSSHDWINQRDPAFDKFIPIQSIFDLYPHGLKTNRDAWVFNFSKEQLEVNINRMVDFYNKQLEDFQKKHSTFASVQERQDAVDSFIDTDDTQISWSRSLKQDFGKLKVQEYFSHEIVMATYRPYCKQPVYFSSNFIELVSTLPKVYPVPSLDNVSIYVTGDGSSKDFSALITNTLPEFHLQSNGKCFPLYTYEKVA